jgi:hypothetical protein
MQTFVPSSFTNLDEIKTSFKKGLDYQRELFKMAKHDNNFDSMCDSLENIKSEIKDKAKKKGYTDRINYVEQVINWYRTKELRHIRNTPDGKTVIFPPDIHYKINQNLTKAYEVLIEQLSNLDLL